MATLQASFAFVDAYVIAVLIGLPFQITGQIIVWVGAYRSEHVPSNRFHRAFAFCDGTLVGKALLWLCLCSTALSVFAAVLWVSSGNLVDALFYSTIPYAFAPVLGSVMLRFERWYPNSE